MTARPDRDGWMHVEVALTFLVSCAGAVAVALLLSWAWNRVAPAPAPAAAGIIGLRAGADRAGFEGWV